MNLEKQKFESDLEVATLKKKLSEVSLKKSKPQQNPELTRLYKQLQSMLASELSKNSALRDALAAGVNGSTYFVPYNLLIHVGCRQFRFN